MSFVSCWQDQQKGRGARSKPRSNFDYCLTDAIFHLVTFQNLSLFKLKQKQRFQKAELLENRLPLQYLSTRLNFLPLYPDFTFYYLPYILKINNIAKTVGLTDIGHALGKREMRCERWIRITVYIYKHFFSSEIKRQSDTTPQVTTNS